MEELRYLVRFFNALADETRLRLVVLLARQKPGSALCVGRLARELETTSSNLSQHLRILKDIGLVYNERRGYKIHYYLNPDRIHEYWQLIYELFGEQFLPNANITLGHRQVSPMHQTSSETNATAERSG